jgi:uncharacterized membrane protein YhaH (DUF805 family)
MTTAPNQIASVAMMQQIGVAAEQGGDAEPAFLTAPETLRPDFSGLVLPITLVNVATIARLAAAVARRLHDKSRSGLWGLLPLPTMLGSRLALYEAMPGLFRDGWQGGLRKAGW